MKKLLGSLWKKISSMELVPLEQHLKAEKEIISLKCQLATTITDHVKSINKHTETIRELIKKKEELCEALRARIEAGAVIEQQAEVIKRLQTDNRLLIEQLNDIVDKLGGRPRNNTTSELPN